MRESAPGFEIRGVRLETLPDNRDRDPSPGPLAAAETRPSLHDLHGEVEAAAPALSVSSVGRPTLLVGFRNRTDVAVREFWWEILLVEGGGAAVIYRKAWHSRGRIKAGESETLTHVLAGGKEWVEFGSGRKKGRQLVVRVMRVKYVNGQEWKRR